MIIVLVLLLLFGLSAVFSGSETGFYSVSPLRLESEAESGNRASLMIKRLLRNESGLLITILIGNNLAIELVTLYSEHHLDGLGWLPREWIDLTLMLVLTPTLFLFAELLPKDLFRRRPFTLLQWTVWPMVFFYILFWPLMVILRLFGQGVQKLLGVEDQALYRVRGRERVFEVLEEGSRRGTLEARAEKMARNALGLQALQVTDVMTPWERVERLELDGRDLDPRTRIAHAHHSRLPVVKAGKVVGYAHQLEILAGKEDFDPKKHLHKFLCLDAETSVQAALSRLSTFGKRAALVGSPLEPLGLVSLKDLAERISGDLAGW